MEKIILQLKEMGTEVMLLTPNGMNNKPLTDTSDMWYSMSLMTSALMGNGVFDKLVDLEKEIAEKHDVPVADCYKIWKEQLVNNTDYGNLFANGINHPKREYHKWFAKELYRTIFA